jgi:hypothetical protein
VEQAPRNTTLAGGPNFGVHFTGDVRFSPAISAADQQQIADLLAKLRGEAAALPQKDDRAEAVDALAKVESQLAQKQPSLERIKSYLAVYSTIVTVASPTVHALTAIMHTLFGG